MAKAAYQPRRCGDCHFINHDAYRGAGKKVCYQVERNGDRKVAITVSEDQKACTNFEKTRKIERVG